MRVSAIIFAAFLAATVAAQTTPAVRKFVPAGELGAAAQGALSSPSEATSAASGLPFPRALEFGAASNDFVPDEYELERRSLREVPTSWGQEQALRPETAQNPRPPEALPQSNFASTPSAITALAENPEDEALEHVETTEGFAPKRDYLTEDQPLTAFKQPDEDAVMRARSRFHLSKPEAGLPVTPTLLANTETASSAEPARAASPARNLPDAQKWRSSANDAAERHGQSFASSGALPEGSSYLPAVAAVGLLGLVVGLLMRKKAA